MGRTSTQGFAFNVASSTKKFDYVQVRHEGNDVLCQIVELEREGNQTTAYCNVIGYRDKGILKQLLTPPEPNTEVLQAEDEFIKSTLGLKEASKKPGSEIVATLSLAQVKQIAEDKIKDMNDGSLDAAMKSITGTARSMGIKVATN